MSLFYLNTPLRYGDSDESSWPFGALTTGGQRGQITGGGQQSQGSRDVLPKMDWIEQDGKYVVMFELPGIKKKEVEISLQDNILTISGTFTPGHGISEDVLHLITERTFGTFSRSVSVPAGLKQNEITATMECGLLRIEFPKEPTGGVVKRIAIQGGE